MPDQELEVKFFVGSLSAIEQRVQELGGRLSQARIYEVNLRFDTPDEELQRTWRVLRLRQDARVRLTYKGPGFEQDGVRVRQELEVEVDDFETARRLLEALGYQVSMMYEKYRAVYELEGVQVTLDEMPFGPFVELEGPDGVTIQAVAASLDLEWEARNLDSYTKIFADYLERSQVEMRDLSFENFAHQAPSAADLGLRQADGG